MTVNSLGKLEFYYKCQDLHVPIYKKWPVGTCKEEYLIPIFKSEAHDPFPLLAHRQGRIAHTRQLSIK